MSTHDYNLANQSGASFRSDLNNALAAILSNNSNASDPSTTVAFMIFADTNANKLKIRNSANDAFIDLINLDGSIARDLTFTGASANIVFDQSDNALEFADNATVKFGNSGDLKIFHSGSESFVAEEGTGGLTISSGSISFKDSSQTKTHATMSVNGSVDLYFSNSKKFETYTAGISVSGNCKPETDNTHDLGTSGNRWDDVRATNATIQTSDKNEKNTITATDLGLDFVNKLTPVSFKFNSGTRTHYGLIAQDIETVLTDIGKSTTNFAGFIKDTVDEEGNSMTAKYALRYAEFISPIIKAIQELSAKVAALEAG